MRPIDESGFTKTWYGRSMPGRCASCGWSWWCPCSPSPLTTPIHMKRLKSRKKRFGSLNEPTESAALHLPGTLGG
eukprot:4511694-Pleurochrysis_carterae.AAC.2